MELLVESSENQRKRVGSLLNSFTFNKINYKFVD